MTVDRFISPDLLPPNNTDLNPVHYKHMGINATAGIASSWCRWTEAALNRCLASLWAKPHRWLSWSLAQMSLRMNLCEMKTFWAFNLTPLTHMLFCVSCLLILWTLNKCYCVKCIKISQQFRFLIFRKVVLYIDTSKVWWALWHEFWCKFLGEYNTERIFKIAQHLSKL